jgi:hypothetical protein
MSGSATNTRRIARLIGWHKRRRKIRPPEEVQEEALEAAFAGNSDFCGTSFGSGGSTLYRRSDRPLVPSVVSGRRRRG